MACHPRASLERALIEAIPDGTPPFLQCALVSKRALPPNIIKPGRRRSVRNVVRQAKAPDPM
jgi:hypothetical protein